MRFRYHYDANFVRPCLLDTARRMREPIAECGR